MSLTNTRRQDHKNTSVRIRTGVGTIVALIAALVVAPSAASASTNGSTPSTSAAQAAEARIVELEPSAATWTTARAPEEPQATRPYASATSRADQTWLTFDTSALSGLTVTKAELRLDVEYSTATGGALQAYDASTDWSEADLTYSSRPAHRDTLLGTATTPSRSGETVSIPLSNSDALASAPATGIELRYSQKYVSTTYSLAKQSMPTLVVTVDAGAKAPVADQAEGATSPGTAPVPDDARRPASDKLVLAHYFPPYPISIDNKDPDSDYYAVNYLRPGGENGKHASYGGLLRDRPLPRSPLSGDWKLADLRTEVRQAKAAGIDGFTLNVMSLSGRNWTASVNLMKAADVEGDFVVVPNLDATATAGKANVESIAAKLAVLYSYDSAYVTPKGALALSSFKVEKQPAAWWSTLISALERTTGSDVAFIAIFLSASDANMAEFAPISYAMGNWGTRTVKTVSAAPDYAAKAHALGKKWVAPVAPQDVRPRSFLYDESNNTETLRTMWRDAIDDGADMVQMVTWNDYSESTHFAPSRAHGTAFLDVSAPYIEAFRSGSAVDFGVDTVVVSHRTQMADARPSFAQKLMRPTLSGSSTEPRDTVEVVTMLKETSSVTVTVGASTHTYTAKAGLMVKTFPLEFGVVKTLVVRDGTRVANLSSPYRVTSTPYVQDEQYHAVVN